jgi:redox-sensing transcriptional repressor
MRYSRIPNETIRRLPIYLRGLAMMTQQGIRSVSSSKLAEFVNLNSWQIRKDFSYFGDFGTRGVGYDIENLSRQIRKILKIDAVHKTVLVGVGNLGSAILAYQGFEPYGFCITAAFDNDPAKIGTRIKNIAIKDVKRLDTLDAQQADLAIIAVPEQAAQEVADALVKAGIKGILNFSPRRITVPKKVKVITIDIATDLARLPYYIPSS